MLNLQNIVDQLDYAFQPIVYSHNGKIFGVEALIRGVQNIKGINTIDDLFNLAFNENFLYEFDLLLREKAIRKFGLIKKNGV